MPIYNISSFNSGLGKRELNTRIEAASADEAVAVATRRGCCGYYAQDIQAIPLTEAELQAHLASLDDGDGAYGGPNHDI
jgi:hypothetical protein